MLEAHTPQIHTQQASAPSPWSVREKNASLKALRHLHHASSYLLRDRDALRLLSIAMLQKQDEHNRLFGLTRQHNCEACQRNYQAGSERARYPSIYVPTSPRPEIVVEMKANWPTPPSDLLHALAWSVEGGIVVQRGFRLTYHVFYLVPLCAANSYCGVFGDGRNGWYEWFVWDPNKPAKLETSSDGWGSTEGALRAVLNATNERGQL